MLPLLLLVRYKIRCTMLVFAVQRMYRRRPITVIMRDILRAPGYIPRVKYGFLARTLRPRKREFPDRSATLKHIVYPPNSRC